MTIKQLVFELGLIAFNPGIGKEKQITGGHVGDLLSHVMANCQAGNAWVTILTNINTIAVASLTDAACIILPHGIRPEQMSLNKATELGIPILGSELPAFELCGKLSIIIKS